MPLIIALLIIAVGISWAWRSNKQSANLSAIREQDRQKTNAKLEHHILDTYMKHGYSFDDAFNQTADDMRAAGYIPCIPRTAYKNRDGIESSSCGVYGGADVERYDSFWVKQRREEAIRSWQQSHPGVHISKASPEEIDKLTYDNYPMTEYAHICDMRRSAIRASTYPIGTYIFYPGLGTCEVLAHNWIGNGASGGTYTLKVLKTGKEVTHVRIGDNKIRRQGQ